jgi:hypothetical protein
VRLPKSFLFDIPIPCMRFEIACSQTVASRLVPRRRRISIYRRSLKLLFGDLSPHDDCASEACFNLASEVPLNGSEFLPEDCFYRFRRPDFYRQIEGVWDQYMIRQPGVGSAASTRVAISQMKPTSSRATAVVATFDRLLLATSRRYRPDNLSCAFQEMSFICRSTSG